MFNRNNIKDRNLLIFGLALMADRMLMQAWFDRTHRSNDLTDFALGLIFGIGLGMVILFVWRNGRRGHGPSAGASAG